MLSYAPYFGEYTKTYIDLIEKLKRCKYPEKAKELLAEIDELETDNTLLLKEVKTAIEVLQANLEENERE